MALSSFHLFSRFCDSHFKEMDLSKPRNAGIRKIPMREKRYMHGAHRGVLPYTPYNRDGSRRHTLSYSTTIEPGPPDATMDPDMPATHDLFDKLPLETLQNIGHHLEDADLANFQLVSKKTFGAIEQDSGSFWRERFENKYDPLPCQPRGDRLKRNGWYRTEYKLRQALVNSKTWRNCIVPFKARAMRKLLKDLVIDAFTSGNDDKGALAIEKIFGTQRMDVVLRQDRDMFDQEVFKPRISDRFLDLGLLLIPIEGHEAQSTMAMLLVSLTPLVFRNTIARTRTPGEGKPFTASRIAMYGSEQDSVPSLFRNDNASIDFNIVLEHVNFWRYYLCQAQETLSYKQYAAQPDYQRPAQWGPKPDTVPEVWTCAYSMIDALDAPFLSTERDFPEDHCFIQRGGVLHTNRLVHAEENDEYFWPPSFEQELPAPKSQNGARQRIVERHADQHIYADGTHTSGWIDTLPEMYGMEGWKRISFMRYKLSEEGEIDTASATAYDGVILPNCQMMIGQFWSMDLANAQRACFGTFVGWPSKKAPKGQSSA